MSLFPVFGKAPAGARLQRIRQSTNYRDGSFHNLVPTDVILKNRSRFGMWSEYQNRPPDTAPQVAIPSVKTDLSTLPADKASIVWFGHSSYLLKLNGKYILVDPVFSGHASPVSYLVKAFPGTNGYGTADMPEIDLLLLTHDHYDHLDYHSILQLLPLTRHICTSLGVGAHLESWGVNPGKITELDWNESASLGPGGCWNFTAMPARHFSGRSFKRGRTLWSSFVLKTGDLTLFLGGDSGYEKHFKTIGDNHGPFDLAILECGQYGKSWPYIHMTPEETVQAALDLRATALLPVHWGKFMLALHPWNEPPRRVTAAAGKKGLPLAMPMIGEPVNIRPASRQDAPVPEYPHRPWWDIS